MRILIADCTGKMFRTSERNETPFTTLLVLVRKGVQNLKCFGVQVKFAIRSDCVPKISKSEPAEAGGAGRTKIIPFFRVVDCASDGPCTFWFPAD